jgi:hypothetical protein
MLRVLRQVISRPSQASSIWTFSLGCVVGHAGISDELKVPPEGGAVLDKRIARGSR